MQIEKTLSRSKADFLLLVVAALWGSAFIAQEIASRFHIAFLYNGASFLSAAILLFLLKPHWHFSRDQIWWTIVAGAVLFAASSLQQVGLLYTKVANASFLTSLYVLFTPFLLWIFFREKVSWINGIAVLLAGVGAFFLSTNGAFVAQPGDVLEVLGAVFWALHLVIIAKFAFKYEPVAFAGGHFVVCGVLNLICGFLIEPVSALGEKSVLLAIAYRALLSIGIGYTLQIWAQRFTSPTSAALILGLESVFAAIAAGILLGDTLTWLQILGCCIILAAVTLGQMQRS